MKYLYFTYVDAKTGIPCLAAPMRNGPANPGVAGLLFGFALESRYPTPHPVFYGSCPDDSATDLPGVLGVITEAEYQQAEADEWAARRSKVSCTRLQARLTLIAAGMWAAVVAYFQDPARTPAEVAFFEDAQTWRRDDPMVQGAGTALGLSAAQMDDLFAQAAML